MHPMHKMSEAALELSRLDGEGFAMEAWVRAHPAMRTMCSRLQRLVHERTLVYSALVEEWKSKRDGDNMVYPDEGKTGDQVEIEWKGQSKDEERIEAALSAAIAKYNVFVPVRKQQETPKAGAEPAPETTPAAPPVPTPATLTAAALESLFKDAPKDDKGDVDWLALVTEIGRAMGG